MLSPVGDDFGAPDNSRGHPIRRHVPKDRVRGRMLVPHPPPIHPAATAEVGQLLDLGLALGHERFELVSLLGREEAGMVAAHAWADCGCESSRRDPVSSGARTRSRPRASHDDAGVQAGREELQREVEWLRERVDNLSRELVLARKDSGRLAKQLKQEERVGREQRRKADEATREAKSLKIELDRLKENRSANSAASRAVLSDAHSRSVRMAERRRRQQAESLMQAYKGLYEDQLQTQHASAESYRSLTRGYSRLSADNKSLRRETAAVAAFAAAARDAAGNAAALISSSVDLQQGIRDSSPPSLRAPADELSCEETAGPSKKEVREEARVDGIDGRAGVGIGNFALSGSGHGSASRAARSSDGAVPGEDDADGGGVGLGASFHAPATPAESASAVATAAEAVAAAAGALAEAANTASTRVDGAGMEEEPSPVSSAPLSWTKHADEESATAPAQARACGNRSSSMGRTVVVEGGNVRATTGASIAALAEINRPSTAETFACSPFSDDAADSSATVAEGALPPMRRVTHRGRSVRSDGVPASHRAPPADCSVAPGGAVPKNGAVAHGEDVRAGAGGTKGYAFPQTAGEDDISVPTEGPASSSAAAPSTEQGNNNTVSENDDQGHGEPDDRLLSTDETSKPDERFSPREKRSQRDARPARGPLLRGAVVAVPPEKSPPRWRGRSAGPGRLLLSSASRAEAAEVDAPKRSSSPTGPRRGRWGDCVGGGGVAWGGAKGAAGEDACIRIEPSYRARPHSI
ncbi:unnamed protein product [Hapterophycus canaliculatus]